MLRGVVRHEEDALPSVLQLARQSAEQRVGVHHDVGQLALSQATNVYRTAQKHTLAHPETRNHLEGPSYGLVAVPEDTCARDDGTGGDGRLSVRGCGTCPVAENSARLQITCGVT